jgi:hypothetical protein
MCETARILKLGEPTDRPGLVYHRAVVQDAIDKGGWSKVVSFGLSERAWENIFDLAQVTHEVERVYIEDDWLMADLIPLDTDCGKGVRQAAQSIGYEFHPIGTGVIRDGQMVYEYSLKGFWGEFQQQEGEVQ